MKFFDWLFKKDNGGFSSNELAKVRALNEAVGSDRFEVSGKRKVVDVTNGREVCLSRTIRNESCLTIAYKKEVNV